MANPYDKARELMLAIKESQEYQTYMAAKDSVSQNQDLVAALNDYQEKQFDIQRSTMTGEEVGPEAMQQMQSLFEVLSRDPAAAAYLQAQIRYTMMVNSVFQQLGEIIKM